MVDLTVWILEKTNLVLNQSSVTVTVTETWQRVEVLLVTVQVLRGKDGAFPLLLSIWTVTSTSLPGMARFSAFDTVFRPLVIFEF